MIEYYYLNKTYMDCDKKIWCQFEVKYKLFINIFYKSKIFFIM